MGARFPSTFLHRPSPILVNGTPPTAHSHNKHEPSHPMAWLFITSPTSWPTLQSSSCSWGLEDLFQDSTGQYIASLWGTAKVCAGALLIHGQLAWRDSSSFTCGMEWEKSYARSEEVENTSKWLQEAAATWE